MRSKADFSAMRKGKRINSGNLRLVFRDNDLGYARLGLAVSRKYGNAVQRNRLKRQMRDIFRSSNCNDTGVDILLIPTIKSDDMKCPSDDFIKALVIIKSRIRQKRHA